jgi:hypothetical protein
MPKVNFIRTEVTELMPRWNLVRDVLSGELKIKAKGVDYLPKPNAADDSPENAARYEAYKLRAVFYGVTARTLKGLSGQVFSRDPVVALPPEMDVVKADVDGAGVSLDQQSRKALAHTLAYGRAGILADYPVTDKPATKADMEKGEIRPTVTLYDPWDIINWRTITRGAKKLLSLVVLSESCVKDDDGFEAENEDYFRVLRLKEDGTYWSQVWYFDKNLNDFVMESEVQPKDGKGAPWTFIPFTFIGPDNNDETPDLPPLYDLAVINVAHYRNSADYEESCFITGQPTPWFAGLTQQWVEEVLKGKIPLGARAAVLLPENGSAGLLQAEENTMPKEAMEAKERQMVALGAKLVEQKQVQRTALEAGMEEASTSSLLATCAKNVSHAYTAALSWCALFLGIAPEKASEDKDAKDTISYVLNSEFDLSKLTPQEVAAIIAAWQANAIAEEEMRDSLRRGGIAYLDDEAYREAVATAGISLGVPVGSPASQAEAERLAKEEADKKKASGKPPVAGK